SEVTQHIELGIPGVPRGRGSDYASFVCAGAPAFNLSALNWGYGTYTWHTNRDTFDTLVFDDIRNNVVLTAMLAYLASEDPQRVARTQRVLPPASDRPPRTWPQCRQAQRSAPEPRAAPRPAAARQPPGLGTARQGGRGGCRRIPSR